MIDCLYENFKFWSQEGSVWLYSDPHFGDKEAQEFRNDGITDEEQIRRINSKVGKNDTIVFLGDIGDTSYVSKIKGNKVLIMGNHDKGKSNYVLRAWLSEKNEDGTFTIYDGSDIPVHKILDNDCNTRFKDNGLFFSIYDGPVIISKKIILSHEPLDIPCMLNIHGHCHSLMDSPMDFNHINVCAEHINYTPIALDDIIKSGKLKAIEDIHRITINKAKEKSK